MKASTNCLDVICHYEGFESKPYLCPAGVPTIGWGTTVYPTGKKVKLSDPEIDKATGLQYLQNDLQYFEKEVLKALKVPVSQNMFDGLVSFAYNLGEGALKGSTLLRLINGNIVAKEPGEWKKKVATEFAKWVYAKVKGVSKKLSGLVARRTTESILATDGIVKFFN